MNVSIERGNTKLIFGRSMILSRIEAEPLAYDGDFPSFSRDDMMPKVRHIELEGYIVSTADTPDGRAREIEGRRRNLAKLTAPGEGFLLRVGDKYANLTDGRLTFKREAPFAGDESERFVLRAVISGGFFHKKTVKATVRRLADGAYLPAHIDGEMTAGIYSRECVVDTNNEGDVSVGFTAEFYPMAAMTGFSLVNTATYQHISCKYAFRPGDLIRISTLRDSLRFTVTRSGAETNLTGYASEGSELFLLPPKECLLTMDDGSVFTGSLTYTDSYITF